MNVSMKAVGVSLATAAALGTIGGIAGAVYDTEQQSRHSLGLSTAGVAAGSALGSMYIGATLFPHTIGNPLIVGIAGAAVGTAAMAGAWMLADRVTD